MLAKEAQRRRNVRRLKSALCVPFEKTLRSLRLKFINDKLFFTKND
jgi:ribosomal protein L30/L7E